MAIPTVQVYSTLTDPSGMPVVHAVVVASLIGPTIIAGASVDRQIKTYTNDAGQWALNLIPNSLFGNNISDSWYLIRVGNKEEYRVFVPAVTNNVVSYDISTLSNAGTPFVPESVFNGNILFEGDVLVQGNLLVSGTIIASTAALTSPLLYPPGVKTTFFNSLHIIGNLKVTGTLRYTGTISPEPIVDTL